MSVWDVLRDIFANRDAWVAAAIVAVSLAIFCMLMAWHEERRITRWESKQQKVRAEKTATILLVDKEGIPTSFLLPKYSELPRDIHFKADPRNPTLYRIVQITLRDDPLPADA